MTLSLASMAGKLYVSVIQTSLLLTDIFQDDPNPNLFATEIRNCAGSNVALTLWSAKVGGSFHNPTALQLSDNVQGQRVRTLNIPVPTPSPTLGLTLQWSLLSSTEDVWHILDVIPNSPADAAGLLPYGDYIVGTPEGNVHGEAGLGELVEDFLSRTLRLYVYNHEYGVTRLVTITPSRSWGGNGALGCVLGFGALHRLPAPMNEPPAGPGETLFETARFSNEESRPISSHSQSYPSGTSLYQTTSNAQSSDLLVPATLASPPPPPMGSTPSGPPRTSRKARKPASPNSAFEEYFKEGEQKSKEEDSAPAAKSAPPPPPKMGAHPHAKSPEPEAQPEESAS